MRQLLMTGLICTAVSLAWTAAAQEPPRPCLTDPAYRAFDFWIGNWEVYDLAQDRKFAGTNRIQPVEAGCALYEQWRGEGGGSGVSINHYSPTEERWRQLWVSAAGYSIDIAGGLNDAGAMVLEGTIDYHARQKILPFRGTWTPNADGTVRQTFEQQDPDSGEWKIWFDGLYVREEAAE